MASFDAINYSLRPSKSIQRQLIFEGVGQLKNELGLERMAYVGLGSIWFTDFVLAHKFLGVDDMVSIEADPIGYKRARFNAPFASIEVREGRSSAVLPQLFLEEKYSDRPWMVWLDYDYDFDESVRDDLELLVEQAPANTILLVTFNGHEAAYGGAEERLERLRTLFGDCVPENLSKSECKGDKLQRHLADFTLDYLKSTTAEIGRPGGFVPAFRILYRDGAPMVTAGGILPNRGSARLAADLTQREAWPCRPTTPIVAPHLTIREAISLQSQLPRAANLTRAAVQALGFDLDQAQIDAFQTYYRQYPAFAQIVA